MSTQMLYDEPHVIINRTIGRRYNNPLGDEIFPLLATLVPKEPRVLDVGCGRGASSLWWAAHRGAKVSALDLSAPMLGEARESAARAALGDRIDFALTPFLELPLRESFDLILFHDVLCYEPDKPASIARGLSLLREGGVISLTDYHASDLAHPAVGRVVQSWGIVPPPDYATYRRWVRLAGLTPLSVVDTTGQYRAHWDEVERKLRDHQTTLLESVGPDAIWEFAAKIEAIRQAVLCGQFGHLWAVLRRPEALSGCR